MTAARRAIAGTALAIGLPLATAGLAAAQSQPPSGPASGPSSTTTTCPGGGGGGGASGPSGPTACPTTTSTTRPTTAGTGGTGGGGSGLARTGGEAALPLAAAAGAITVVLGGRRLASRLQG